MPLLGIEAPATSIRGFASHFAPELLMTVAYARSSFGHGSDRVDLLLARQKMLCETTAVELDYVLDEAVLHRVVGDER